MRAEKPVAAQPDLPGVAVAVYPAEALPVLSGANADDPLPLPGESIDGDYYRLREGARPLSLILSPDETLGETAPGTASETPHETPRDTAPAGHVAPGSPTGQPGAAVYLRGRISLMAPDGDLVEIMVLECAGLGRLALPLSPLMAQCTYTQIGADARPGPIRLADAVSGAFAGGTRIALADGRQLPVEALEPGMEVITRDHGAQPLRWKGNVRLRAEGTFAPVVIMPGTMGNPRPLIVSPHHRLFLYRRKARAVAGGAELLIQARHLVDERRIRRRPGGWVSYFGLVFDRHEVIYAEGVPCESLMVCPATLNTLPEKLAAPLRAAFPGLHQRLHVGRDIGAEMVSRLRGRSGAPPATS
ncbi:MAG: Hint domain-containing protein [Pararhodobacter sp.]|nr:Hint domain-containing protein [Pararhodobacter sp.]